MKKRASYFILNLCFVFCSFSAVGQSSSTAPTSKSITHQHLLWFRYYNKLTLSDKWQINTEVEDRMYFHPYSQSQNVFRTQAEYKIDPNISASLGFTVFLQYTPQDQNDTTKYVVPELRPHQQFTFKNKSGKLDIQHRIKLEERIFHNSNSKTGVLLPGYDNFYFRLRYQLQLKYPIIKLCKDKPLYIVAADEIMVNFGHRIVYNSFDQNRLTVGLAYDFSKMFGVEVDYVNWFQQRTAGDKYYNRHIGRFTLYHYIDLSKKKEEPKKS